MVFEDRFKNISYPLVFPLDFYHFTQVKVEDCKDWISCIDLQKLKYVKRQFVQVIYNKKIISIYEF